MENYIIIYRTNKGLEALVVEDYDKALEEVKDAYDACIIVRIENICDRGCFPPIITIEKHNGGNE